jgi:hypothetical protein
MSILSFMEGVKLYIIYYNNVIIYYNIIKIMIEQVTF